MPEISTLEVGCLKKEASQVLLIAGQCSDSQMLFNFRELIECGQFRVNEGDHI